MLALEVKDLKKYYGSLCAVNGISFNIQEGTCFGLLGPNGAGKTTTIEMCEGLLKPSHGEILMFSRNLNEHNSYLRQRIGVQLQESHLNEKLTVRETINLFRSFYQKGHTINTLIDLVQLNEKINTRVGKLSGGQKQRLSLACALVGDPDIVFLDEPTTGLDPQSRRQLWNILEHLKNRRKTIILTTHYMDEAEFLCDKIAIIDYGTIIALNTPQELIRYFGGKPVIEYSLKENEQECISIDELSSLPGVISVTTNENRYNMQVYSVFETIPALLSYTTCKNVTLSELRTHLPKLEDAFVALTGKQIRDV
jgi:ABC-2 type transport system ATP-binding protein